MRILFLLVIIGLFQACKIEPQKNLPDEQVMHFPFTMALKDQTLLVSSQNSDGKYSYARLVALDTNNIKKDIKALVWKNIITSNIMIPSDTGLISFEDYIIFASREANKLIATSSPLCNKPSETIKKCPQTAILSLTKNDPYALAVLDKSATRDKIIISYLSSDRLDLIELDKSEKSILKLVKSFKAQKWIENYYKKSQDQQVITKKIITTSDTVYFLLERKLSPEFAHKKYTNKSSFKLDFLQKNIGSLLVSVKIKDLLEQEKLDNNLIKFINLHEFFGIASAQDIYIDETDNTAVILGREPEELVKIKLDTNLFLDRQTLCRGSSSFAVSKNYDQIYVPCFIENRVLSFKLSSFAVSASSDYHGRGPVYVAIDEIHDQIFVSYNIEGIVGVFDKNLVYQGHIFQAAAANREGS